MAFSPSLLLLAMTLGGTPAELPAAEPAFVATGKGSEADGSARASHDGLRLRVREIAGAERSELLWKLVASGRDPLAGRLDGGPRFRTFLLEADNGSTLPAQLNPSFFELRFGEERRHPLGYAQAFAALVDAAGSEEEAARVAPLLAETSFAVAPGERVVRLLAFDRVSARAHGLTLKLPELRVGDQEVGLAFRFERPKPRR